MRNRGTARASGRGAIALLAIACATLAGCTGGGPAARPPDASTPAASVPPIATPDATTVATHGPSMATWPPPPATLAPERLPSAGSELARALLTCGARPFPRTALDAPTGAEHERGPEFDALRLTLAQVGPAFGDYRTDGWRLVARDDRGATFLARATLGPDDLWLTADVTLENGQWAPGGMGGCRPQVVLSADFGPASWALDNAYPAPTPASTELHVLVWETACSSGSPTSGRMSAPLVELGSSTVTITIGVRPLDGVQTCPLGPGTPAIVTLPEPLGRRTLLDGGGEPPAPPTAP